MDDSWRNLPWERLEARVQGVLKGYLFDPLTKETLRAVAKELLGRGVDHERIVGEYDEEKGWATLAVVLPDGREVRFP